MKILKEVTVEKFTHSFITLYYFPRYLKVY